MYRKHTEIISFISFSFSKPIIYICVSKFNLETQMGRLVSYGKIISIPRHPRRGFRIRRRFCVNWLRVRFFYLLRFFCKWKFSCDHFTRILVKSITRPKRIRSGTNNSKNNDHFNTFYSEAISECLEYIKLSSAASAAKN